jgi:hypothetical protein
MSHCVHFLTVAMQPLVLLPTRDLPGNLSWAPGKLADYGCNGGINCVEAGRVPSAISPASKAHSCAHTTRNPHLRDGASPRRERQ